MAARRVAAELGERVGETAGYQVRFEEIAGPKTRLRFMTEGVLTRKLLSDPSLRNVATSFSTNFTSGTWMRPGARATVPIAAHNPAGSAPVVMSATMDARQSPASLATAR